MKTIIDLWNALSLNEMKDLADKFNIQSYANIIQNGQLHRHLREQEVKNIGKGNDEGDIPKRRDNQKDQGNG